MNITPQGESYEDKFMHTFLHYLFIEIIHRVKCFGYAK